MTMHRSAAARLALLPALAAIGVLAAGCGGSGSSGSASPTDHSTMDMSTMSSSPSPTASASQGGTSSASKLVITIKDFAYSGPSSVPAGSTVTVKNEDAEAHTLTSDKGKAFDVTIAPGKSATFTAPATAGSYPYHCNYHANMHGTLKVS